MLRLDHSGWPFLAHVTAFTFRLLVYPVFATVFLLRQSPGVRIAGTAVLLLALLEFVHARGRSGDRSGG